MSHEMKQVIERSSEGCCGGPAPTGTDACCVADAEAKASGDDGCGCGTEASESSKIPSSCC